ncbi:CRAL-TRIO domain-containing protein [Gorgonomyces haynaldii]|nr:CRAL-TRIO domain-containing protein [Gorgonomyces haynaldii]
MDAVFFAPEQEQVFALASLKNLIKQDKHLQDVHVNDHFLKKCLWAKHNDPKLCLPLVRNYTDWYRKTCGSPDVRLSIKDVHAFLLTGIFVAPLGHDNEGFPIIYMRPNKYYPGKIPYQHVVKALVFMLEHFTEDPLAAKYGFTFVCDMKDWGWSNFGVSYAERFFNILQGRFPIRLRKFVLVNPPSMFSMVWMIIRPMMTEDFASKWALIKSDQVSTIMPLDNAPPELGGTKTVDMETVIKDLYEKEGLFYEPFSLDNYNWKI